LGNLELRKIGASRGEGPLCGVDFSFKKELIKKNLRMNYDKKLSGSASQERNIRIKIQ
jgi:hypothetical protein